MLQHTRDELGTALGCIIYDMLMLFAALSVHRKRQRCPKYEELTWGEPQIAIEVILLKCRSLMDFLSPLRRNSRDILIKDFGCSPISLPDAMQIFRKSINQWSAHLSWQRVHRLSTAAPQPAQSDMEVHALWLLFEANKFVKERIAAGLKLTQEHHERFYRAFQKEYAKLVQA